MELRPSRGGFLRPFGCGWFIREFLLGNGPVGSKKIDPLRGAVQADINYEYKEALARATAQDHAERIISGWWLRELMLPRKKPRKFISAN